MLHENVHCSVVWWLGRGYFCIFCQTTAGWTDSGWVGCCPLVSFVIGYWWIYSESELFWLGYLWQEIFSWCHAYCRDLLPFSQTLKNVSLWSCLCRLRHCRDNLNILIYWQKVGIALNEKKKVYCCIESSINWNYAKVCTHRRPGCFVFLIHSNLLALTDTRYS